MTDFRFHVNTASERFNYEYLEDALERASNEAKSNPNVDLTVTWGDAEIILREWEDGE